ncbi:MAG: hypothetical protein A2Y38_17045 [Spirochaetes bacterium GWB1_59_5]|nr:MAG: hypothetical protein A2Y38_17045 [Spirochaetes bacterium GWB1_59_5]
MKAMKARLIVDVVYHMPDELPRAEAEANARGLLGDIALNAYDNGTMSGDTSMAVEKWTDRVECLSWEDVP